MKRLTEDRLAHDFPDSWEVAKYDDWSFYRKQFQNCCGGNKAMDFLAYDPADRTLWLVELKDYRRFRRIKDETIRLWDEVALKARDTLAGLFAVKTQAGHENARFAGLAVQACALRVVLHLEQPGKSSKMFPRAYDLTYIQQELKKVIKPLDPHPLVIESNQLNRVPWTITSIP